MTAVISIGNLVATAGVDSWVREAVQSRAAGVASAVARHITGDWGEVCSEDKESNDYAADHQERVLSSYTIDSRKVWIITEWDRSVTTILFPEEY